MFGWINRSEYRRAIQHAKATDEKLVTTAKAGLELADVCRSHEQRNAKLKARVDAQADLIGRLQAQLSEVFAERDALKAKRAEELEWAFRNGHDEAFEGVRAILDREQHGLENQSWQTSHVIHALRTEASAPPAEPEAECASEHCRSRLVTALSHATGLCVRCRPYGDYPPEPEAETCTCCGIKHLGAPGLCWVCTNPKAFNAFKPTPEQKAEMQAEMDRKQEEATDGPE